MELAGVAFLKILGVTKISNFFPMICDNFRGYQNHPKILRKMISPNLLKKIRGAEREGG